MQVGILCGLMLAMPAVAQTREENPPQPTPGSRPSTPPLREKRMIVPPPAPEAKPGAADPAATSAPHDNCAKGHTGTVQPVGAHIIIPPGKAPKAVCDQPNVEAEPVWKGQNLSCAFTIRNEGDADLFIRPKAT